MIKEKARRPRRTVKGTVLFTVVCVMMVLIVFLMGTLALAATANKRANYKYQRAQNETIARTVIEAVVTDIKNDTSEDGINHALADAANTHGSFDMTVTLDGREYPVHMSTGGKQSWYNAALGGWVEGDIINLTTTVASQSGNEPVNYNASVVMAVKTEDNPGGGGGGGGAFVALGELTGKIGTSGLATGGTEVNLSDTADPPTKNISLDNESRIEAPAYFNSNLTISSQVTTLWNSMNVYGDKKRDAYFAVTGDLTLSNNTSLCPQFGSEMKWKTSTDHHDDNTKDPTYYYNIPCIYVGGKLKNMSQNMKLGNVTMVNGKPVLDDTQILNLYCGCLDLPEGIEGYGDIYCFDANRKSAIGIGTYDTNLYQWVKKTVKYPTYKDPFTHQDVYGLFGNFFSRGEVYLGYTFENDGVTINTASQTNKAISIGGDLRVDNTITARKLTVGGDIVCKKLVLDGDVTCKNIYANEVDLNGHTLSCENAYVQTETNGPITYSGTSDSSVTYPGQIYPDDMKKDEIKNKVLKVPNPADYTNSPAEFPTTLADFSANKKTVDITALTTYKDTADHVITNDCILEGSFLSHNITLKPTGELAVIIKNVELMNGHSIKIDTSKNGTVFFFLLDNSKLTLTNGDIITDYYQAKFAEPEASRQIERNLQADYPPVYVFGAAGSSINIKNGCVLTANVRAPLTTFTGDKGKDNFKIKYKEKDGTITQLNSIAIVGQLIANKITVANEFTLAYVNPNEGQNGGQGQGQQGGTTKLIYTMNGGSVNYTIY